LAFPIFKKITSIIKQWCRNLNHKIYSLRTGWGLLLIPKSNVVQLC
jgi:hypothetical protein